MKEFHNDGAVLIVLDNNLNVELCLKITLGFAFIFGQETVQFATDVFIITSTMPKYLLTMAIFDYGCKKVTAVILVVVEFNQQRIIMDLLRSDICQGTLNAVGHDSNHVQVYERLLLH